MLLILTLAVFSNEANADAKFLGFGGLKCSKLNSFTQNEIDSEKLAQWAMGFWSGINVLMLSHSKEFHDISSVKFEDDVANAIRSKCKLTPESRVLVVAMELLESFPIAEETK